MVMGNVEAVSQTNHNRLIHKQYSDIRGEKDRREEKGGRGKDHLLLDQSAWGSQWRPKKRPGFSEVRVDKRGGEKKGGGPMRRARSW